MRNSLCRLLSMAMLAASISFTAGAQTVKTFISLPTAPLGIAANPATDRIYVVSPGVGGETTDNLAVIDENQECTASEHSCPSRRILYYSELSHQSHLCGWLPLWCDPVSCTVTVINGKTNAVVTTIPVTTTPGFGLAGIVANPITGFVYIANASDNVINIIDGCQNKLAGTIGLNGNSPFSIAINPILNRLYVPFGNNLTDVVDITKKQILATTTFGNSTVGAAANLVTGHVFVTDDEGGPSMTGVLDKDGAPKASITVDDFPLGVDVDPVTNLAFVASTALDSVTVIESSTNIVKTIVTGVPATYIAVNLATQKVYVSGRDGVTVLTEK